MSRRVLVTGGRRYADRARLFAVLDAIHAERSIDVVIDGACPTGADELAHQWADDRGVEHLPFRADWPRYGPAAGPIRNERMVHEGAPDVVVAFPGGRGTRDCVMRARDAGILVWTPEMIEARSR